MVEQTAAVDRELASVGAAVRARLPELTEEICQQLAGGSAELRGDDTYARLLNASVAENTTTLLDVFEHATVIDDVHAPAAAHENARRLAQRGIPVVALVRNYRIAHGRFLARFVEQIAARSYDNDLAAALVARLVAVSFDYIDHVSEQVIDTYQHEREQWLLAQAAGRAARVRALLADQPADIDTAETALGYRLRRTHLGLVTWLADQPGRATGLAQLEQLASRAARALQTQGRPLFVPRDEALAWIWLPFTSDTQLSHQVLQTAFADEPAAVRVAAGEPATGLAGFRQTHRQALSTHNLARIANPGSQVTTFAEVGALALLCSDLDTARSWVLATLNDLAIDDEPHARLRDTLLIYMSTGSYTLTAERMMLHKNTAQYRVGKAEQALGAPLGERRIEVGLALRACHHLGRAVLRHPPPSTR